MQNIKVLLAYTVQTTSVLTTTLKDGFQLPDLLPIGMQVAQLPNLNTVLPAAKEEWANRTDDQVEDLKKFFAGTFDVENDSIERKVEKVFSFVVSGVDLIGEFTKK